MEVIGVRHNILRFGCSDELGCEPRISPFKGKSSRNSAKLFTFIGADRESLIEQELFSFVASDGRRRFESLDD